MAEHLHDDASAALRLQIEDLRDALGAIRAGGVDAIITSGPGDAQVYTLASADRPYRLLVEEMSEGALTVSSHGVVLYANATMVELLGRDTRTLVGSAASDLVSVEDRGVFAQLLRLAPGQHDRRDVTVNGAVGPVPVQMSASCLDIEDTRVHCFVITDLRDRLAVEASLRAGERRLRQFLDAVPLALRVIDGNAVEEYSNAAAGHLLAQVGLGEADVRTIEAAFVDPSTGQGARDDDLPLARALAGVTTHVDDLVLRGPTGPGVPLEMWGTSVMDDAGTVEFAIVAMTDVTERREAQRVAEELRISDERFRVSFENGPVGMALLDLRPETAGRFLRANLALCALTGYDEEQLMDTTTAAITHPEDRATTTAVIQRMVDGLDERWSGEKRYRSASGDDVWVQLAVSVVHDGNGLPSYAVSQVEDITDRKRDEAQLLERFHEIANHVDVGFLIYDLDSGSPLYSNPAFLTILGLDPAHPAPTDAELRTAVDPDDRPRVGEVLSACAQGQQLDTELRFARPDGQLRWASMRVSPIIDPEGRIRRAACLFEDITDRRAAQDLLLAARAEAERANAAKDEFLSRLSHELRTPLNAVLGFGQLLQRTPLDPDQDDAVDRIMSSGRHLLTMIEDILDVTKMETGHLPLSPVVVDLGELIEETLALMRPAAAVNGVGLHRAPVDGCVAFADRRRLKQVLLNLLSNAIKYNQPRGRVEITVADVGDDEVSIAVADTGLGIPSGDLPRLFAPFDRLGREATTIEGTGIGLTLTKSLVTLMNGRLEVVSIEGAGSTFTVTLPTGARPSGPAPGAGEAQAADAELAAQAAPAHLTLLYIDGDQPTVDLIEAVIRHRPAWTMAHATEGAEGLQMAAQLAPALILLDLQLPDMDGAQVLSRLKSNPASATIPIGIIGDDTLTQPSQIRAAGADRDLTKPLDLDELFAFLDANTPQARTGREATIVAGRAQGDVGIS